MKIALLGDIALIGRYDRTANNTVEQRVEYIRNLVSGCDFVIANQEGVLTNRTRTAQCKGVYLRSAEENVKTLQYMGVTHVTLANNHIYDYGTCGRKDTNMISVIMGIYNCASTLPAAIDSILNQTYSDWQLIMCDDCSTDNTYEVAAGYAKQYPEKIVLIRNEKNMRLAYTLNHCLQYATGEYVARMDGDDRSCPERFEKQIRYLNEHPDIQLVGTAMQVFNEDKGNLRVMRNAAHPDKYSTRRGGTFFHATILTYKYVYDRLGGYTVADRTARCEDYDLWFRFYAEGFNGDNMSEPLYLVREDMEAVKRRTFRSRWEAFQTTAYGYKLLGFPKVWLVQELFTVILKSITPHKLQYLYHMHTKNEKCN